MELLYLMNEARWGKAAMRKPIDRTKVEILTMDEFRVIKDAEHAVEQAWLAQKKTEYFAAKQPKSNPQ
jgi:hypothetical protein